MRIRTRLTLLFTLISSAIMLVFSFFVIYFFELFRAQEFYNLLYDKAYSTAELVLDIGDANQNHFNKIDKRNLTPLKYEDIMLFGPNDSLIFDSGDEKILVSNEFIQRVRQTIVAYEKNQEREQVGIVFMHAEKPYVVVSSAIDVDGFSKIQYLKIILTIGWLIYTVILILVSHYFSLKALQPMQTVIQEVSAISAQNLNLRVNEGNGTDEIALLAITFNQMLERIEQSFIVQKNFVSNASHELRTPLTALIGQLEVSLMQARSVEEYQKTLALLLEDAKGMSALINGLLHLASVGSDRQMFQFTHLRVDELVLACGAELMRKKPGCKVAFELDENVDDVFKLTVLGSEQYLRIAFFNLLENACKYSENQSVKVMVLSADKAVSILFIDKGKGIDKADLPYIFEPFYRSNKTQKIPGHGIGLSLTKKIVELHQGSIDVRSALGVGSIFTVKLPTSSNENGLLMEA